MEVKKEIEKATIALLLEKGVSASINEIIKKTGISKGAFYHYYSTKQQLIKESVEDYFTDQWQLLEEIKKSNDSYQDKIEALVETLFDPYKKASQLTNEKITNYLSLINEYLNIPELRENYYQFQEAVKTTIDQILENNRDKLDIPAHQDIHDVSGQIIYLTSGVLFYGLVSDIEDILERSKREIRSYVKMISK
ncbi:MAG: TetR/AcrR family transcriptional regulator [Bacteroidales bacterium]|nr:TetR/AcrR family transcriptional regulator [Bacteroidales bacterium]